MKNKLTVLKQLENVKINATLIENMLSRPHTTQEYMEQVIRLKDKIEMVKALVERESDDFV